MGDRLFAEYQIINIQKDQNGKTPEHVIVGNYKYTNVGHAQPEILLASYSKSREYNMDEPDGLIDIFSVSL